MTVRIVDRKENRAQETLPLSRRLRSDRKWSPFDDYLKWNEQVNQYFLREDMEGKPLYLDPQPELYRHLEERFGLEYGQGKDRLLAVVRNVMHSSSSSKELFAVYEREVTLWGKNARALSNRERYQDRSYPPPVAALLVTTVIAAQSMQESTRDGKYVSSTNYYNHLITVFGLQETDKEKLRNDFRVTEEFWEAFNWWLEDMEGRFGLPTAHANHHRYVGLPVSQAIIRIADRQAFQRMFAQYALLPGSLLSLVEMESLIDEWTSIHGSGASKEFIQKWNQASDVRERIAETAITELRAWDGDVDRIERSGSGTQLPTSLGGSDTTWVPLAMVLRGRHGERESADLGLALRRAGDMQSWNLVHEQGEVPLRPRELSPTHVYAAGYEIGIDSGQLLTKEIRLTGPDGRVMQRRPRHIVLLVQDEAAGAYLETRRAVSGARHRILVSPDASPDMIEELRTLLTLTSFAGNKDLRVEGIDEDWLIIDGFIPGAVANIGDFTSSEVTALLAPIETQFTVQGGLRLPGRLKKWHAVALPDIIVTTAPSTKASFEVRLGIGSQGEQEKVLQAGISGPCIVQLPESLEVGDYRVSLHKSRGKGRASSPEPPLQTEILRLRTGTQQDYEGLVRHQRAAHDTRPVSAASALTGIDAADISVLGVDVLAEEGKIFDGGLPGEIDWSTLHHRKPTSREALSLPAPAPDSCILTGSHVFQFPTFLNGKTKGKWQTGTCSRCGAVRRTPINWVDAMKPEFRREYEERRGRALNAVRSQASGQAKVAFAERLPEVPVHDIRTDVVVDALVHTYSGDVAALQGIVAQSGADTGDQANLLRDLSALGLVEAIRDDSFRRERWEITPPALLTLANGKVALGGGWSLERMAGFRAVVEDLEAELHPSRSLAELPTVIGASASQLMEYIELDGVTNAEESWRLIAGQLPALSEIASNLPRRNMRLEQGPFQMFQLDALAWIDVSGWGAPGLYRRDRGYHRRDYWYRTEQDVDAGTAAAVDVELGKHLLAQAAGRTLLGFHQDDQVLTTPLGARLPELYERAVVLSSGRLPESSIDGFYHAYRDVTDELAAALRARMSS
jgi:hypothetical protein